MAAPRVTDNSVLHTIQHVAGFVHRFGETGALGQMDCFYSYWLTRRAEGFNENQLAALRGRRGVVRVSQPNEASLAIAGSGIVGFTFSPGGNALVATSGAVYDVALGIEGWRVF